MIELKIVVLECSELAEDSTYSYKDDTDLLKITKSIIREI